MKLITIESTEQTEIQQVTDGNDHLDFALINGNWFAVSGKINNVCFRSHNGVSWEKLGKGRISQQTTDKLQAMNSFFRKG
jgi:hypothetical protein